MNVAMTGISSGLGQALVPKLQQDPSIDKIIGIDLNAFQGEKIQFFKVDVRDQEQLEGILKGVDVLIHLAFIVIPKKLPKKKIIYDINVNGSKTVFHAAAKNNVKQIIHLSSQSAYGHVPECPEVVDEGSPLLGIETKNFYYSRTKAVVERYLDEFEKEFPNIKIVRIRPPIITGPHFIQNLDLFINDGKTKKTVMTINHQGKIPLQLIHEDDLTDVIMLAIKNDLHGAFNVAGRLIPDTKEFLKKEQDVELKTYPRWLINFLIKLGRIYTKASWLQALKYNSIMNTEKIEKTLNWKPEALICT